MVRSTGGRPGRGECRVATGRDSRTYRTRTEPRAFRIGRNGIWPGRFRWTWKQCSADPRRGERALGNRRVFWTTFE
jgi:hypothetical protein